MHPFKADTERKLAETYDLMATDASLEAAAEKEPDLWGVLDCFKVFARMSPQGKAKLIRNLQECVVGASSLQYLWGDMQRVCVW